MKDKELVIGTFRAHEKGFGFVEPENNINKEKDIFIPEKHSNGALNEDVVEVEVTSSESGKSREGKVKRIIRRGKETLVGTFQNNKNFGFVIPDDKRFGTDIFISKKDFGKARHNHKVVVKITKYPEKGKKAEGKIIEVIGNINQSGVDMLSIIKEYKLPSTFPDEVTAEAKAFGTKINPKEIKGRRDLRRSRDFHNRWRRCQRLR